MRSTPSARNARILSARAAGATNPKIGASLELDPSLAALVIRDAARGRLPDISPAPPAVDPAWLAEAYATNSARKISLELGVPSTASMPRCGMPASRAGPAGRAARWTRRRRSWRTGSSRFTRPA